MAANEQACLVRVKCLACDFIQEESEFCRRCRKKLPKPVVKEIIREVPVLKDLSVFGGTAPVLAMREYERKAIVHALERTGRATEAAKALGIGKTTFYRKLQEHKVGPDVYVKRKERKLNPKRNESDVLVTGLVKEAL